MSTRELGPAIFSMAETLERTGEILYQDRSRLRVDVCADFKHGSFGIDFVAAAVPGGLIPTLTVDELANLLAVVGFAVGGMGIAGRALLSLIRWQNGRKVDNVQKEGDDVRLTIRGESLTVNIATYNLFRDRELRDSVKGIVEPLREPGIDALEIRAEQETPVRIEKGEARIFSGSLALSRFVQVI